MGERSERPVAQAVPAGRTVNRVQLGVAGPLLTLDPQAPHVALQSALDTLAESGGGELLIHPGYHPAQGAVPYVFSEAVRVDVPDVCLRFAPGAVLAFGGADALFHVRAPRLRCESARVVHEDTGSSQRSCFLIGDPGQPGTDSDDAVFVDCHFALTQASADTLGFSCIRAEGDEGSPRRGLRLEGCTFDFGPGVRSSDAWQGDDPFGLCAVRARNSALCTLTANRFRGPSGAGLGHAGTLVLLDNAPESSVASNVFVGLDLMASNGTGGSVVRVTTHRGHVGHGTRVGGNVFHAIDARHAVELVGARFDAVDANSFAELGPDCDAALVARGPAGEGLVIAGNAFRAVAAAGGRSGPGVPIRLAGVGSVTVSANVFGRLPTDGRALEVEAGSCSDVHVAAAQAISHQVR